MKLLSLLGTVAMGFMGACAAQQPPVWHEAGRSIARGGYKTFRVVSPEVVSVSSFEQSAKTKLREAMSSKGYQEVSTGEADLVVSFKVLLGESQKKRPTMRGVATLGGYAPALVAAGPLGTPTVSDMGMGIMDTDLVLDSSQEKNPSDRSSG